LVRFDEPSAQLGEQDMEVFDVDVA
jgi:hypothetical protein